MKSRFSALSERQKMRKIRGFSSIAANKSDEEELTHEQKKNRKKRNVSTIPVKKVRRNYKDRLFRFIFGNENHKDWALNLYNAMENKQYTDPADLKIVTLENAVYMHIKKGH